MSDHLPASPIPISAVPFKGTSATYIYADGSTITLYGNRPYRNNNPGNLRYSGKTGLARAQAAGAIGLDNGFAIFPSVAAGDKALDALIALKASRKVSLTDVMHTYAPPSENKTTAYIATIALALGVTPTTTLDTFSDKQKALLAQTIIMVEGSHNLKAETAPPTTTPATGKR